jgi:UDP-GlcNAc:undecaprenyl-phosphate/decaprenyl-phosphate GlcNAc-1-phosphate transferase
VKIVSLVAGALFVGWYLYGFGFEALYAAFVLAGCANLGNLFDVRPGRAVKFVGVPAGAMFFIAPGWAVLAMVGVFGGVVSLFYFDLKARMMLGDAGAAGVGSLLGCLVAASGPSLAWWVAGAAVVFLTLIAEFSSISRVIEEVRVLRWFDNLGRGR